MDMHTLHVEHAALLGLFTLLTIVNSSLNRGAGGSQWFPSFTFCAFVGAVLIALRGRVPAGLSIFFGDLFFSLAYVFLHRSVMEFFGRRQLWVAQLVCFGLCAALLLKWGVLSPDTRPRLFWYSLVLTVQVGLSAAVVLKNAAGTLRGSGRLMGGLLLVLSVNNFLRAGGVGLYGAPADYLRGGTALSVALLLTTVLQGAVTIAFVWMTAARLQGELAAEATTDPLTRVLNRRAIETRAKRAIASSLRTELPVSAILIDLDDFKMVNDLWGHGAGDLVLQAVARRLGEKTRGQDGLARLGGDEFAVLLPRTSLYEALDVAEAMRCSVEELRCEAGDGSMSVRASFGVAQMQDPARGWDGLIQQCDRALYRVKAEGGNQVLVH